MGWLGRLAGRLPRISAVASAPRPATRRFPIAILSFDRPDYLRQVLASLLAQIDSRDVVLLFQDGSRNNWSGRVKGDPDRIDQCVAIFRKTVPWGGVLQSENNIGIALNYERAERYVFETLGADSGLFLEDDMVLSPSYLAVIRQLLGFAERDVRIGYVSAYGNFWANPAEQRQRSAELIPMHENWGAALTRRSWLAERPFRAQYIDLIANCDYSLRDHQAIRDFYAERGWKNFVTSQNAARWIACLERDAVRLTTFACHARYIGERGEHFSPEYFAQARFGETIMFEGAAPRLAPPSSGRLSEWLAAERARFLGTGAPFYPAHGQR